MLVGPVEGIGDFFGSWAAHFVQEDEIENSIGTSLVADSACPICRAGSGIDTPGRSTEADH